MQANALPLRHSWRDVQYAQNWMRYPRIELGPHRWQRRILTTELIAHIIRIVIRSHHGGNTRSHLNSAVKHHWARLVLRWGTTREPWVLNDFLFCLCAQYMKQPKYCYSDSRFRSSDLWVMSPTRYRCAKSLYVEYVLCEWGTDGNWTRAWLVRSETKQKQSNSKCIPRVYERML